MSQSNIEFIHPNLAIICQKSIGFQVINLLYLKLTLSKKIWLSEINKRTVRNKFVQVGKIAKINKRTCTTIPHFRVDSGGWNSYWDIDSLHIVPPATS